MRWGSCLLCGVGILAAFLLARPAPAFAQDRFGALAYGPSAEAQGWSNDQSTKDRAAQLALQECGKRANDCRLLLWFRNACGSLAKGPRGYGSGWGIDKTVANTWSMEVCGKYTSGCQVRRTVCTSILAPDRADGGEN